VPAGVEAEAASFRVRASTVRAAVMEARRRSMEEFGELYEKLAK